MMLYLVVSREEEKKLSRAARRIGVPFASRGVRAVAQVQDGDEERALFLHAGCVGHVHFRDDATIEAAKMSWL